LLPEESIQKLAKFLMKSVGPRKKNIDENEERYKTLGKKFWEIKYSLIQQRNKLDQINSTMQILKI